MPVVCPSQMERDDGIASFANAHDPVFMGRAHLVVIEPGNRSWGTQEVGNRIAVGWPAQPRPAKYLRQHVAASKQQTAIGIPEANVARV